MGWVDVEQIPAREVYWFSSGAAGSTLWSNTLVLDRKKGRAYLQALGD